MAKADSNYSYGTIQLSADIGGMDVEVVQAVLQFPLGDVARATVKLAVGESGSGSRATGYKAVAAAKMHRAPAKVNAYFSGQSGPGKSWGSTNPTMFEGFVGGPRADAVAAQTVGLEVNLEHVSSELDLGSKVTHVLHAESVNSAGKELVGTVSGFTDKGNSYGLAATVMRPVAGATSNIWGALMKPLFTQLASSGDRIADRAAEIAGIGRGTANTRVLQALGKVVGSPAAALQRTGNAETTANAIWAFLINPESGQSFLDTMKTFGAVWHMALIPRFTDMLYVPYSPVLNQVYTRITADECFMISSQSDWPRVPVRGVALQSSYTGGYEANTDREANPVIVGLADVSQFGGSDVDGQMVVMQAPAQFSVIRDTAVHGALLPAGGQPARIGNVRGGGIPPSIAATLEMARRNTPFDDVAKAMLVGAKYAGRSLTVVGRVRTDICPGSLVEVELIGDRGEFTSVFGCVTEVKFLFNAEQPYACTNFTVSHLRTPEEQRSGMIMSKHPLYGASFIGSSMGG